MGGLVERYSTVDGSMEDLDSAAAETYDVITGGPAAKRDRAREEMVTLALPFAGRLARRYRGHGEPLEDLTQVAALALVKAVDRYDPKRGSFTAYAAATITGEIKRHFRDRSWAVHVPRRLRDLVIELGYARAELTMRLRRPPTQRELAAHLDLPLFEVRDAMGCAAGYVAASLNAPAADGTLELGDLLGDLLGDRDEALESVDDRLTVDGLVARLPERERRILCMRFYGNLTQAEIAARLGVSQMHVSRLLSRCLSWLREALLSETVPPWPAADAGADPTRLAVQVDRTAGRHVLRLGGEIDRDTAPHLSRVLDSAVRAGGPPIELDLAQVPLIDAAGLGALVCGLEAARNAGVAVRVVGARPMVRHVLAFAGVPA